jgi:hypothetical protein
MIFNVRPVKPPKLTSDSDLAVPINNHGIQSGKKADTSTARVH